MNRIPGHRYIYICMYVSPGISGWVLRLGVAVSRSVNNSSGHSIRIAAVFRALSSGDYYIFTARNAYPSGSLVFTSRVPRSLLHPSPAIVRHDDPTAFVFPPNTRHPTPTNRSSPISSSRLTRLVFATGVRPWLIPRWSRCENTPTDLQLTRRDPHHIRPPSRRRGRILNI